MSKKEEWLAPRKKPLLKRMGRHKSIYLLFVLPALIWFAIFCYVPMYGITLAFKDYSFSKGILFSPWVGFGAFKQLFTYPDLWKYVRNTFAISGLKLVFGFPLAILLALFINEIRNSQYKKAVQTVSYLPYFVSWAVVAALFSKILSVNGGLINDILGTLFGTEPIFFLGKKDLFWPILVITEIWKNIGWNTIIYLSALTSINEELYEAAYIDGCSRLQRMYYISLPGIKSTIAILLILSIGNLTRAGFEQVYLFINPAVMDVGEILDTYILRVGLTGGSYSYATAAGLVLSLVSLVLIVVTNFLSKKMADISLW